MTTVEILVDGRPALTTRPAAEKHGFTPGGLRAIVDQVGIEPVAEIDGRTPVYDEADLERKLAARPGRGAHFRRSS